MLDFACVLYLGLRHPAEALPRWPQLTSGVPLALAEPPLAGTVAVELAELTGAERATVLPSTLHACWDLFGMLANDDIAIHLDEAAYPVSRWGAERAAALGTPVWRFSHHSLAGLARQLRTSARAGRRPVVVTDGVCPGCVSVPPLAAYHRLALAYGGELVVDDTQGLGLLGPSGGGALLAAGVGGPSVVTIASLAKGFGVPVAAICGSARTIGRFEDRSETRMHSSPPSIAHLLAASHALAVNRSAGDRLRARLRGLVRRFRHELAPAGVHPAGGGFPVQTIVRRTARQAIDFQRRLLRHGVRAVAHHARCGAGAGVSFVLTNLHSPADIDSAVEAILLTLETDHELPRNRDVVRNRDRAGA